MQIAIASALVSGGCFLIVALVAVSAILRGFVLTQLWTWFVLTTFPGTPVLSIPVAIGLAATVGMLSGTSYSSSGSANDEERRSKAVNSAVSIVLTPLLALIFGWIVWQFAGSPVPR